MLTIFCILILGIASYPSIDRLNQMFQEVITNAFIFNLKRGVYQQYQDAYLSIKRLLQLR